MKTSLITALLAVGILLRPQPMTIADNGTARENPVAVSSAQQVAPQVLTTTEMKTAVGNGLTGCYQTKALNGDVYITCCLDLWVFAVCVAVNWTAVQSIIPFL